MPSHHETFFDHPSFALVGHSARTPFPLLSYRALRRLGKRVYAIDPSASTIDGEPAYPALEALPEPVAAMIIEAPRSETRDWVAAAARAGVRDVWIHMGCDTPEAIALAETSGIDLRTGTCAVMYVTPGLTYHSLHKAIMKMTGKY